MAGTQVVMAIAHLLFAFALRSALYSATTILGICYGFQFSVMIPTASELFGLKHFGVIYNFIILGNPLGALIFSGFLAGYVYDREAATQSSSPDQTCLGANCFKLTFEVLAAVCLLGSLLSAILTLRTKPVYRSLYAGGSFRIPQGDPVR